jgi:hypothetical protein
MATSYRAPILLFLAGVLAVTGALFLQDPDRVSAIPLLVAFGPFPLLLRSMIAAVRWGLFTAGLSLLLTSLYWNRISDWLLRAGRGPERPGPFTPWALFLVSFFLYLLVGRLAFLDYPLTPDEFSYLYQAKLFARGQWTVPAHPLQEFFRCAFIAEHKGRLFSIMPVGWSLLLAPWVMLGVPWVLSPLCTALAVVLTYQVGRSIYGHGTGILAAMLMAPSPFVVFYGGNYMSHQVSLLAFMAFLYIFVRMERGESATYLYVLLGCVIAAVPILRNTELATLLPFFMVFAFRFLKGRVYSRPKLLLSATIALTLFFAFTGWHNHSLTGSPLRLPFQEYVDDGNYLSENLGSRFLGIHDVFTLKHRAKWWAKRLLSLNYALFPFAPLFLFLPLVLPGRRRLDLLLLGTFLSMSAGYMLYGSYGGVQFGPRYYFPSVGMVYLLIAAAFPRLASTVRTSRRAGVAVLVVLAFVCELGISGMLVRVVPDMVRGMRIIQDAGAHLARHGIHNSVIFLAPCESDPKVTRDSIYLRIRNRPDFDDDNLVAVDRGKKNKELMAFYPNRRFFLYKISVRNLVRGNPMSLEELRPEDFVSTVQGSGVRD